jgi:cytochrome c peroxidase
LGGCHNLSNVGASANPIFFDINISDAQFRTPDLPLYTLRNLTTGEIQETTDPGRALITGRWADVGRFKAPALRGLASHPPFFHNGLAAELIDVVKFYEQSLGFNFNDAEEADLVAFLKAL